MAISIVDKVYIWSNSEPKIAKICSYKESIFGSDIYVCSVNWNPFNDNIAIGRNDGVLDILDSKTKQIVRSFKGHTNRVNVSTWNKGFDNPFIIATGSKDSRILLRDLRIREEYIADQKEHTHEICGMKFSLDGNLLASGGNDNLLLIWDVRKLSSIKSIKNYSYSSQSNENCNTNQISHMYNSINNINNFSNNVLNSPSNNFNSNLLGHQQTNELNNFNQYGGIELRDNNNLQTFNSINSSSILSSNNNNRSSSNLSILKKITDHRAAVKALAWCPYKRNVLASGGGSHDQTIKFWDTSGSISLISSLYSGSQVCNMVFSQNSKELISTHGYSQNQIIKWNTRKLNNVTNIDILTGHIARVLYLAISPEGDKICTAAGSADETVRIWKVFEAKKE